MTVSTCQADSQENRPLSGWADFPPKARAELASIEAELDEIWPGWRKKLRFDKVDYGLKFKIKGLLKKHQLLSRRECGVPAPRYWDVLVVRDGKDKSRCYAHPILPKDEGQEEARFSERKPPEPAAPPHEEPRFCEGLPALAFRLRVPLEVLEALERGAPDDLCYDDGLAVEEWLEAQINSLRSLTSPVIRTLKVSE